MAGWAWCGGFGGAPIEGWGGGGKAPGWRCKGNGTGLGTTHCGAGAVGLLMCMCVSDCASDWLPGGGAAGGAWKIFSRAGRTAAPRAVVAVPMELHQSTLFRPLHTNLIACVLQRESCRLPLKLELAIPWWDKGCIIVSRYRLPFQRSN